MPLIVSRTKIATERTPLRGRVINSHAKRGQSQNFHRDRGRRRESSGSKATGNVTRKIGGRYTDGSVLDELIVRGYGE
jgi:hypothetical protein